MGEKRDGTIAATTTTTITGLSWHLYEQATLKKFRTNSPNAQGQGQGQGVRGHRRSGHGPRRNWVCRDIVRSTTAYRWAAPAIAAQIAHMMMMMLTKLPVRLRCLVSSPSCSSASSRPLWAALVIGRSTAGSLCLTAPGLSLFICRSQVTSGTEACAGAAAGQRVV